jgi:hypothetical protein
MGTNAQSGQRFLGVYMTPEGPVDLMLIARWNDKAVSDATAIAALNDAVDGLKYDNNRHSPV